MNHGPQYLKEEAQKAAAHRLRQASTFTGFNIKTPLFQKRMGKGASSVLVRFEWPGVLSVIDPETGELLAVSKAGNTSELHPAFEPQVPALSSGLLPGAI